MPEQSGVGSGRNTAKDVETSKADCVGRNASPTRPGLKTLSGRETSRKLRRLTRVVASVSGHTLKENRSLRELNQEETPWIIAGVENLTADCRFNRHNHREGSPKQYGDTFREGSARQVNSMRGGSIGGNTSGPARAHSASKPFGVDTER